MMRTGGWGGQEADKSSHRRQLNRMRAAGFRYDRVVLSLTLLADRSSGFGLSIGALPLHAKDKNNNDNIFEQLMIRGGFKVHSVSMVFFYFTFFVRGETVFSKNSTTLWKVYIHRQ